MAVIAGRVQQERRIGGSVTSGARITTGTVQRAALPGGAPYEGPYEVTPEFSAQTLETKGKSMRDDVTVEAITVSRTGNPSGGNTIYIGGLING